MKGKKIPNEKLPMFLQKNESDEMSLDVNYNVQHFRRDECTGIMYSKRIDMTMENARDLLCNDNIGGIASLSGFRIKQLN